MFFLCREIVAVVKSEPPAVCGAGGPDHVRSSWPQSSEMECVRQRATTLAVIALFAFGLAVLGDPSGIGELLWPGEGILGGSPRVEMIPLTSGAPLDDRPSLPSESTTKVETPSRSSPPQPRVKPPRGFPDSPRWGDCSPSAMSPATLPTPIRVCILGLPRVGVHSAAFGHQVFQLQVLYSLMRRAGLGPWLDTCRVQLQFNAPLAPGPGRHYHPNASWPSANGWILNAYRHAYELWRPFLDPRPEFFRGKQGGAGCRGRKHPERYVPKDAVRCGWCQDVPGAIAINVSPIQTPIPDAGDIAAAEARAVQRVATAVSASTAAMPTVVLRVPADQAIETHGDYRQGNTRHNRDMHRAVVRAYNTPIRGETLRVTLIGRPSRGRALPPGPNAMCKPRRIRNKAEVARALRGLCDDAAGAGGRLCSFRGPVDLASMNETEQMRVAADTDVYIAYHGSALAHTAFLPDESLVIEVYQSRFWNCWYSLQQTEDPRRGLSWVFSTHAAGDTVKKCVHGGRPQVPVDLAKVPNPAGPYCGGALKDTCRAWNPTLVLSLLRDVFDRCRPQGARAGRGCVRAAMEAWRADHQDAAWWVLRIVGRDARVFLEVPDDGRGKDDTV